MARPNPYLKYEPTVQTMEDVRFQIERLVRAINGIADSSGITSVRSSAGVSVASGDGGDPILSVPEFEITGDLDMLGFAIINAVDYFNTLGQAMATEDGAKRYAHFASMD
jgi:hypothetical protein